MNAKTVPDPAVSPAYETPDFDAPDRDLFGGQVAYPRAHRQMPLPLGWGGPDPQQFADFLVGESNAEAVRHLERFAQWRSPATLLCGPPGSGRTTLARLFAAASGGAVVDRLEDADPHAVFHAWNRAANDGTRLLVVADDETAVSRMTLADARTRLATAPVLRIVAPDPALAAALIERLLADRSLAVPPPVAAYVAARIERSYQAIHAGVAAIDAAALASHAPLSIPTARAALIDAGLIDAGLIDAGLIDTGVINGADDTAAAPRENLGGAA